jgi:hypothetical protein
VELNRCDSGILQLRSDGQLARQPKGRWAIGGAFRLAQAISPAPPLCAGNAVAKGTSAGDAVADVSDARGAGGHTIEESFSGLPTSAGPSPMSQATGLSRLGDESRFRMRSVTLCECSWQAGLESSGGG